MDQTIGSLEPGLAHQYGALGGRWEKVAMRNRRKVSRYLFGVDAKLSDSENPAGLEVRVINISTEGCCVETSGALKVGERRVLLISWRRTEIRAEVAVTWSDPPTATGRAGLSFRWVRPEDQPMLLELCSVLAIQPDSRHAAHGRNKSGAGRQAA